MRRCGRDEHVRRDLLEAMQIHPTGRVHFAYNTFKGPLDADGDTATIEDELDVNRQGDGLA